MLKSSPCESLRPYSTKSAANSNNIFLHGIELYQHVPFDSAIRHFWGNPGLHERHTASGINGTERCYRCICLPK